MPLLIGVLVLVALLGLYLAHRLGAFEDVPTISVPLPKGMSTPNLVSRQELVHATVQDGTLSFD